MKHLFVGFITLLAACLPTQAVLAAGTTAGTDITNQATANYTVGTDNFSENSNVTTTTVAEILNVDVVWQDAGNVTVRHVTERMDETSLCGEIIRIR